MNNKIIYWIIAAFFVFVSTIISIFIYPFIDAWTGTYQFRWIIMTFGGVLLIASTVFYFKYKKSKWPSMIMFPISLLIVLSSIIHVSRFSDNTLYLFDNYITGHYNLYNKLGFKIIDGNYCSWKIGYDSYGDKLLLNYQYIYSYNGDDVYDYTIVVYDEQGDFIDKIQGSRYFEKGFELEEVMYYYDIDVL